MRTVLLRLEGPLQSWGTRSRFGHRDTEREPSKSGVIGLVGAALGMPREDAETLARLASARFGVRVDREGTVLTDYHTVGDGKFRGEAYALHGIGKGAVLTRRDYLEGASFLAGLECEDDLAEEIHDALGAPRWPLFLGRRSCPPSVPIQTLARPGAVELEAALRGGVYPSPRAPQSALRAVLECAPGQPDAEPRQDVPLSFHGSHRRHGRRYVRTLFISPSELTLQSPEAPCISLVAS